MMIRMPSELRRLRDDRGGLAMIELALGLPFLLTFVLGGTELVNYVVTRQRISQLALHIADNAARIGTGSQLQAKTISEGDIEDLFVGAGLQAGDLDIYKNGRVIVTSVEPTASPNPTNTYKVGWQRCRGDKTYDSPYDNQLTNIATGYGPADGKVPAPEYGATMFVEVYYEYQPIIRTSFMNEKMIEPASMMVRDRRDTSDDSATTNLHPKGIYKSPGVTPRTC